MKVDLHVHTRYSRDCLSSLEAIVRRCRQRGIDCVAITDHGTAAGALAMKASSSFPVIVGEEVMSSDGEIIGYFLQETIPNGLPPDEVMRRIKDQGGLVCLPHPFDGMGRHPLGEAFRERLVSQIDIVEVFNARSFSSRYSRQALEFAQCHGLLVSAGSDAHSAHQVGNGYVEMGSFDGPAQFRDALAHGEVGGPGTSIVNHLLTTLVTVPKRLRNHHV